MRIPRVGGRGSSFGRASQKTRGSSEVCRCRATKAPESQVFYRGSPPPPLHHRDQHAAGKFGVREPPAPPRQGPCGRRHAHAHYFGVPAGPLEICSAAAQQAHTGSRNRRMPARILADGRPRAQVQYQIAARLRELQRRGAHGEHMDARDRAQWPTVEAQVCRSRCPLAAHPLRSPTHCSPAHPLTRSAQGARRLLCEVWHDRLHELVVRNDVGRDHEHPAHSASVQRRRLGVWRVRRAAASLLVPGCVLCVSCFCRMPYPRA